MTTKVQTCIVLPFTSTPRSTPRFGPRRVIPFLNREDFARRATSRQWNAYNIWLHRQRKLEKAARFSQAILPTHDINAPRHNAAEHQVVEHHAEGADDVE